MERMGSILCKASQSCFRNAKIIREINHTFLTLVSKNIPARAYADFRPIACCNTIYKIISKTLFERMKPVMEGLVSHNQCAFIAGRNIVVGIVLAHEHVRCFKHEGVDRLCIKIELKKAYYMVNRSFILHMMRAMQFPKRWISLIEELVCSPSFSIIFKGCPQFYFKSNRGVRQGDPIFPYLFAITMDYLSQLMEIKYHRGKIRPIQLVDPIITHLIYADDQLIFMKADHIDARAINKIFGKLHKFAGLELNSDKSKIIFSKNFRYHDEICDILGIRRAELPIRYLGLPLSAQYIRNCMCDKLIDNIR